MRVLATVSHGRFRLVSRGGTDVTSRFPEVAAAVPEGLAEGSVVDGELVLFDAAGRPSFELLAPRIQRAPQRLITAPVTFVVFDLLRTGSDELLDRPYDERRRRLLELGAVGERVLAPDGFDDGAALARTMLAQGWEGVVAKRRASPYRPGVRSADWIKVPHRVTHPVVVGGWKSRDDAPNRLMSLLVGAPTDDGMLRYEGAVGSGMSEAELRTVTAVLRDIARAESPFHGYPAPEAARGQTQHWVEPVLVVDVEHLGRTANSLLRQPTVARFRPDLAYADLVAGPGA
jgi:bifunctional non-homologous end joining protein LigD